MTEITAAQLDADERLCNKVRSAIGVRGFALRFELANRGIEALPDYIQRIRELKAEIAKLVEGK